MLLFLSVSLFSPSISISAEEILVMSNVMMPARDGVELATDIYLPVEGADSQKGSFPAILIRTPYGKKGFAQTAKAFSKLGYAVVTQDVRGRYGSSGEFYIYINEAKDGYDAVEWVADQTWCNGRVGTWGQSYQAATQNALAIMRPPHLTTMFVMVGTSNYVEDGAGRGGAFALLHNMAWCMGQARSGKEAQANPQSEAALRQAFAQLPDWLWAAPLRRQSPLRWAPSYERWYRDWREHATYDDYWKQNGYNFEEYHSDYPEIPIYFIGGWYDLFKRGTINNFLGLAKKHPQTRLLIGPWPHGIGGSVAGDVDFGPDAHLSIQNLAEHWFNQHLRGSSAVVPNEKRVKYFMMGGIKAHKNEAGRMQSGGRWETADSWPPKNFSDCSFYLHPDGFMNLSKPDGAAPSRFQFDPRNPVPTVGGNIDSGGHIVPHGAQNQTAPSGYFASRSSLPLSARADVLTFETQPLEEAVEIAGPVRVRLWVASQAVDTDFTAKLIDVYPPSKDYPFGYSMNLEDGILRMRFRDSREREVLMEPKKIYEISIDLWATANRFEKGHRIRLDISSSNFPMYDINPNTGERLGFHTHMNQTINSVYHDIDRPSRLVLLVRK